MLGVSEAVGGQGVPRNARGTDAHHAGRSFASIGWCARDLRGLLGVAGTGMFHALVHLPRCPRSSPPLPGELRVIENWCCGPSNGRRHRGQGGSPVKWLRAHSGRSGKSEIAEARGPRRAKHGPVRVTGPAQHTAIRWSCLRGRGARDRCGTARQACRSAAECRPDRAGGSRRTRRACRRRVHTRGRRRAQAGRG